MDEIRSSGTSRTIACSSAERRGHRGPVHHLPVQGGGPGRNIYLSGDMTDRIFILKLGAVKIVRTDAEGNEVVRTCSASRPCSGQLPFSSRTDGGEEHAVALTDHVSICMFKRSDLELVLARDPGSACASR